MRLHTGDQGSSDPRRSELAGARRTGGRRPGRVGLAVSTAVAVVLAGAVTASAHGVRSAIASVPANGSEALSRATHPKVRVELRNGLAASYGILALDPQLYVVNGHLYRPVGAAGAIQPALVRYTDTTLRRGQDNGFATSLRRAGVGSGFDWGRPTGLYDASDTVVTLADRSVRASASVYSLLDGADRRAGLTSAQRTRRAALSTALRTIATVPGGRAYQPAAVVAYATATGGMPSGTVRRWPGPGIAAWGPADASGRRCVVVRGAALRTALPTLNAATVADRWTIDGAQYQLQLHTMLPGESGCPTVITPTPTPTPRSS